MNVTGILWTFYPLLGLIAIIEFLMGLAHVFFCLPYFTFALPILCGIVGSITAVYALMLHVPNRCELFLQFLSTCLAFLLTLTSLTEASCLRRIRGDGGATSVCAGILNRTLASQSRCDEALNQFQNRFFVQMAHAKALLIGADLAPYNYGVATTAAMTALSDAVADENLMAPVVPIRSVSRTRDAAAAHAAELRAQQEVARIFIATALALVSLTHLCAGVVLTLYSALFNNFQLSAGHWQVVLGLGTLFLSYAYFTYCCVFFYTYAVTIVAVFCLILTAVPWHFPSRTFRRQLFSLAGAAFCVALLALTSFGIYCWANRGLAPWRFDRDASTWAVATATARVNASSAMLARRRIDDGGVDGEIVGIFRYCHKPRRLYLICERSLHFSVPYIFWTPEQVANEEDIVQLFVYILLGLSVFGHFALFVADALL